MSEDIQYPEEVMARGRYRMLHEYPEIRELIDFYGAKNVERAAVRVLRREMMGDRP